jgi:DNA polymerase V
MPKGGKRNGAGRPAGTGKYNEPTKAIRVPISIIEKITQLAQGDSGFGLPLYSSRVCAGFPSPADDYLDTKLDLNNYLIKHPAATFLVRVSGESMLGAGIHPDDILVVDRSLEPRHDKVVIVALDGQLTVKRLYKKNGKVMLMPENKQFEPIDITDSESVYIWGVVTNVIHSL